MKWRGRRGSGNIEDRRGKGGAARAGGLGIVVLLVAGYFLGIDVSPFLGMVGGGQTEQSRPMTQADEEQAQFVSVVLADTEEIWTEVFRKNGGAYQPPKLVLFSGQTSSACGAASAASGPFYCPPDRKAFLDTDFFQTLSQRLGAKGDFAAAYVVAHEVAHHVQNLTGVLPEVNKLRAQASESDSNRLSVMVELQADCYSGLWARYAEARFGSLEPGDIEEALNAASQIGDDTLQRGAGRAVVPDSFQHGSAEQRVRWFRRGYENPKMSTCDTFNAARL